MGNDEAELAQSVLFSEELVDFIRISVIAPIIASIIAVVTTRLGTTGQLRRLELLEKRLEITTTLLAEADPDLHIRQQLRAQLADITAEILSDFGQSAIQPSRGSRDVVEDETLQVSNMQIMTSWEDLPSWRRWIFPPFTKTILSWVSGIFYYYFVLVFILLIIGFFSTAMEGTENGLNVGILLSSTFLMFAMASIPRLGMRHAYKRLFENQSERRRISERPQATS